MTTPETDAQRAERLDAWMDYQGARARLREAIRVVEEGDENWQTIGDLIDAAKAVLDD